MSFHAKGVPLGLGKHYASFSTLHFIVLFWKILLYSTTGTGTPSPTPTHIIFFKFRFLTFEKKVFWAFEEGQEMETRRW